MKTLDHFSYELGAADCFCEMVRAGVKRLALAHPCATKEERDQYLPYFEKLCGQYGVQMYVEDEPLLTDLFPLSLNRGKYNALFYQEERVLQEYLGLKGEKAAALAQGTYSQVRRDIAWRFGKLLSYTDEGIRRLLRENQERELNLFCNGGGCGEQTAGELACFRALLDRTKPLLYVPLAMEPAEYPGCLSWIAEELAPWEGTIHMVERGEDLAELDFSRFSGVFLGGGNTYRLLGELRKGGGPKLKAFAREGGPVWGGSAGAIVLGASITPCSWEDENTEGLSELSGLGLIPGELSLFCHYGGQGESQECREFLESLSERMPILALPEEDTLLVGEKAVLWGKYPAWLFHQGRETAVSPGEAVI